MLDDAKIEQAARFDGFAALQCRCLGIDALEAIRQYRQLWRIEESFRIITSTMKTRPIFLRTQKHIEGHFVMCFLGFLWARALEYRLTQRQIEHSPEQIKTALHSMEFSVLDIENEPYYLKGKHLCLASKIFALLRLKQPPNIMGEQQALEYSISWSLVYIFFDKEHVGANFAFFKKRMSVNREVATINCQTQETRVFLQIFRNYIPTFYRRRSLYSWLPMLTIFQKLIDNVTYE